MMFGGLGSNKQGLSPYGSPHHSLSRLSGQGAYVAVTGKPGHGTYLQPQTVPRDVVMVARSV